MGISKGFKFSAASRHRMSIAAKMRERRKKAGQQEMEAHLDEKENGNGHFSAAVSAEIMRINAEMVKLGDRRDLLEQLK